MASPFTEDYMNDIVGGLQNKLNESLDHISNPQTGMINPTCKTVLDEIEFPCYINRESGIKKEQTRVQIQLTVTRDPEEILE